MQADDKETSMLIDEINNKNNNKKKELANWRLENNAYFAISSFSQNFILSYS